MAPRDRVMRVAKRYTDAFALGSGSGVRRVRPLLRRGDVRLRRVGGLGDALDEAMRVDHVGGVEEKRVVGDPREEFCDCEADVVMDEDEEEREEQDVLEFEEDHGEELLQYPGKGKGKAPTIEEESLSFRLMDLPAEIRLEIYRACLTRPYKILLSKAQSSYVDSTLEGRKDVRNEEIRSCGSFVEDIEDDEERQSLAMALRAARLRQSSMRHSRRDSFRRTMSARRFSESWPRTAIREGIPSSSHSRSINIHSNSIRNRPLATSSSTRKTRSSPSGALIINLLRTSKQVYKEARSILYSENIFDLCIDNAVFSLAALHQRSRRHIKHIELEVPTYSDILERFSEIVRLSLRYCTGLKTFVIHTSFGLPHADRASNTTVYANGFDILRWLPQQCEVVLKGTRNEDIEAVVEKHRVFAKQRDQVAYARRQLISSEASAVVG